MTERFDPENIDRLFREGLDGYAETPHTHVWESIRKEVPAKKSYILWRWAAGIAILLAFGAGMFTQYWFLNKGINQTAILNGNINQNETRADNSSHATHIDVSSPYNYNKSNSVTNSNQIVENQSVASKNVTLLTNNKMAKALRDNQDASNIKNLIQDSLIIDDSKPNIGSDYTLNADVFDKNKSNMGIDACPFLIINAGSGLDNTLRLTYKTSIIGSLPPAPRRLKFYVGVNASFNHVNIIDRKNLNNAYHFQSIKTLGLSDGFEAGWNITKHWGIEARFTIHSFQGQRYTYRVNEKYMPEREIRLDYYYLPVLVKYQTPLTTFSNFVVMGGFEYGKYRTNDAFEYNQATSQLRHFRSNDVATMVATGIDVPLSRHFLLGLYSNASFGSDLGALSLVPGGSKPLAGQANRQSSDDFSHPHNLIYGLNMAINYRF